jgi:tetratricopeptide (TPR) repeat protein
VSDKGNLRENPLSSAASGNVGRLALLAAPLVVLLAAAVLAAPALAANLGRVRALQAVDVTASIQERAAAGWRSGWAGVCEGGLLSGEAQAAVNRRVLPFAAMNAVDEGDFGSALRLFRQLEAEGGDGEVAATAYRAALELDWQTAAEHYRPDAFARHRQFWGTVFYQAAQQLFFAGKAKQAAAWYRRADALYDTDGALPDLALVECLAQQGRLTEAWDVYRRALVALPPEEAMQQRGRFERLRLAGLRQWRAQDAENARVAQWLEFYEADGRAEESERLAAAPSPMAPVEYELGEGRKLVGLDYWAEDIETGPFMVVDLYIQSGAADAPDYERVRRVVVNQAANGSFAWDAVPDGVRPAGWPRWVYGPQAGKLSLRELYPGESWLCQEDLPLEGGFGSESVASPIGGVAVYVQGGRIWNDDLSSAALGRRWFDDEGGHNYSYAGYAHPPAGERSVAGMWESPAMAKEVAVWLLAQNGGVVCYADLFLSDLPVMTDDGL